MATTEVTVAIEGAADSDAEELDWLTAELRKRLLDLDVASVERVRTDQIPPGAKPAETVALGALAVTMLPVVLRAVVRLVEVWAKHRPIRSVKITIGDDSIDLAHVSSEDQQMLVEHFLSRHAAQ